MSKAEDVLGVVLGLPGAIRIRNARRSDEEILVDLRKFYRQRPRPWRPRSCAPRQPKLERLALQRQEKARPQ